MGDALGVLADELLAALVQLAEGPGAAQVDLYHLGQREPLEIVVHLIAEHIRADAGMG